jgi:2-polyprenyl-6-methoxyphenol hydroxylase-like FAD-dependent oxidoreductase
VRLRMSDGETLDVDVLVGADGIDSLVRRAVWGDTPKREHDLQIFGGFTFDTTVPAERGLCSLQHSRTVEGSWPSIRHQGRDGFQWWVLGAHDARTPFTGDLHATAAAMGAEFAAPLPQLISATAPGDVQRWVLRDRKPLDQWSKGRATIVGDAAHSTSPYAAYGAGMAIEDGYFLGRSLAASTSPTRQPCVRPSRPSRRRGSHTPSGRSSRLGCSARSSTTHRRRCGRSGTPSSITRRSCRRSSANGHRARSSTRSQRSTMRSGDS